MNNKENTLKTICSFYINDWHLTTMILPYIHKKLESNEEIITILQEGIKENIEKILDRMNLKEAHRKQILETNWTSTKLLKYENVLKQITNTKREKINILVNGKKEYIKKVNTILNKIIKKNELNKDITIINCYEISEFDNINEITKKHEYILNTSGVQHISDVFKNEQTKEA